jgi:hypothetical protein
MKQFLAILCLLLLPATLSLPASAKKHDPAVDSSRVTSPDNHIVPYQRIGAIRLGMGMDEVQSLLGKPYSWTCVCLAPGSSKAMADADSWVYTDPNLQISFDRGAAPIVSGIATLAFSRKRKTFGTLYWKDIDPVKVAFQTTSGIALGSSAFDVRRAYGDDGYEDIDGVVMNYKSLGLTFSITRDHIVWEIGIYQPR